MRPVLFLLIVLLLAVSCTTAEDADDCREGSDRFAEYQLFMGRDSGGVEVVTDEEWSAFLAEIVTPRFPDGLTVLDANGQWRGSGSEIVRERSKLLVILAPPGDEPLNLINEVKGEYSRRYRQDSVLMTTKDACVSFG